MHMKGCLADGMAVCLSGTPACAGKLQGEVLSLYLFDRIEYNEGRDKSAEEMDIPKVKLTILDSNCEAAISKRDEHILWRIYAS